jgi:hypothetical protein
MTAPTQRFLDRLDAVLPRLTAHAREARPGLTRADPATGERWDAGQVWAHLAEFGPFWMGEVRKILAARSSEPVPFGRVKADTGRVGAIAANRHEPAAAQLAKVEAAAADLRDWLRALPDTAWSARGLHSRLGVMSLERIVEEFLVGHYEEHAAQLDELAEGGAAGAQPAGGPA